MRNDRPAGFWSFPLMRTAIRDEQVRLPEMLLGYLVGPFGALLSSGIFTSMLQNYFTDVLKLDLTFLTTLQLVSTIHGLALPASAFVRSISCPTIRFAAMIRMVDTS